jgi:predicted outer membrane protein
MHAHRLLIGASSLAVSLTMAFPALAQVVTAGGEVTGLAQKKIVDRMIVADSLEIEMARLATSQTKNPAVRDLAALLATGHRSHLESLRKLAESPDVGREPGADSINARDARALAQLRSLPADTSFDRAFVAEQFELHQRMIDNLKKWRSTATNAALREDIDHALPILEAHLARAQAVAAKL